MNEQAHRDETTANKTERAESDGRTRKIHPDYFRPIDHESVVARRASRVCYTPSDISRSSFTSPLCSLPAVERIIYDDEQHYSIKSVQRNVCRHFGRVWYKQLAITYYTIPKKQRATVREKTYQLVSRIF